ncbi:hypothetical protein [Brevibacterium album]|uniref:hypothetical protein n=1 Tax=Brevibacterium album TaxID=417948 RepID=UPI0003F4D2C2|nr:hypothetical protein [Brevibacterium album]
MSESIVDSRLRRRAVCLTVVRPRRTYGRSGRPAASGSLEPRRFRAVYGRGLMWTGTGARSLDRAPLHDLELDEVRDTAGEWFLAFHRAEDDSYRFLADLMGYYRLYYSTYRLGEDEVTVVGDNQTSVVAELRRQGRSVAIDWPVAAAHLLSSHTLMHSSFSHRTMFEGVRSLPAAAELVIDEAGTYEVPHDVFSAPAGAAYRDLLSAGIARAQSQIRALAHSSVPDKRHAVSGGRDSRVALAITHSAGVHSAFTAMTGDPRTASSAAAQKTLELDLETAHELRAHLGMEWSRETGVTGVPLDFHTSLDVFQSRWAGAKFTWPCSSSAIWPTALRLEVHGGSGELLRRAYQNVRSHPSFAALADRPETVHDDARALFSTAVPHARHMTGDLRDEAAEVFAQSMALGHGLPLSEQLNRHYAAFRNRDHFGELLQRYDRNALVLYPLAQPEFLQASRLLDDDDRARGRLAYDIIQMCSPKLNEIPFDDGPWRGLPAARPPADSVPSARGPADFSTYFAGEDADRKSRGSIELIQDPGSHVAPFDNAAAVASFAMRAGWELADLTEVPIRDFETVVPTLLVQNSLNPGQTAAKIETMGVAFTGRHSPYESVLLSLPEDAPSRRDPGRPAQALLSGTSAWHHSRISPPRHRRPDPFTFSVALRRSGDQVSVAIHGGDHVPEVEWAVYLYAGSEKKATRWYSSAKKAVFPLPDIDPGTRIRALAFARLPGHENRLIKRYSEWMSA